MIPHELEERTKQFTLRVIELASQMPETVTGQEISQRIIRTGIGVGLKYGRAIRSRSRSDYRKQIALVCEHLGDSTFYLEILIENNLMPLEQALPLLHEARELFETLTSERIQISKHPPKKPD